MSFSDYLENKLLDHILGDGAYTSPTAYVGLSTADPLDSGAGLAEPAGGSYARVATIGADWNPASAGSKDNATIIDFGTATASWGTVTHFAIFDALTAGNLLASGILVTAKAITNGDPVSFPVGSLTVTLD